MRYDVFVQNSSGSFENRLNSDIRSRLTQWNLIDVECVFGKKDFQAFLLVSQDAHEWLDFE